MFHLVVFAWLLAGVLAGGDHLCPWALGKYPFDENKFLGDWYVIASSPASPIKCSHLQINATEQGRYINYNAILENGKKFTADIFSKPLFKKDEKASSTSLSVILLKDLDIGPFIETVIATDYDSFAAVISCRSVFKRESKSFERELIGTIMSRESSLSDETLYAMKNVLSTYDIDPETIQDVNQASCEQ